MSNTRKITTLLTAVALVACFAVSLQADPLPDRDVLKFSQRPMDGTQFVNPDGTIDTYFGHDELSTAYSTIDAAGNETVYRGRFMADDFADTFNTPVVHVKWWGSYLRESPDFPVDKFLISFESDEPESTTNPFSYPKEPLLNQIVRRGPLAPGSGTFTEKFVSPGGDPLNEALYEYNAELHLDKPFPQDNDTVYWLKIVALVDLPPGVQPEDPFVPQWGWHNRDYTVHNPLASPAVSPGEHNVIAGLPGGGEIWHFQDNAVQGDVFIDTSVDNGQIMPFVFQDPTTFAETYYLDGIDGPAGPDGLPGIGIFSKDLAFELYTTIPEPSSVLLMLGGLLGLVAVGRGRRK